MRKNKCERCGIDFQNNYVRRFCSKKCWYEFNAKTIASYNENRFQWKAATEEEKIAHMTTRFNENVIKKDGCWDWKGYFDKNKYPLMNSGANHKGFIERRAHRISWLIHKGKIPENKYICHKCDNPRCTNPDHLFIGSVLENNQDKTKKGRGNLGEKHGNAKFTNEIILEIRKMYADGYKVSAIMKMFHISRSHVHDIVKRKIWKHI